MSYYRGGSKTYEDAVSSIAERNSIDIDIFGKDIKLENRIHDMNFNSDISNDALAMVVSQEYLAKTFDKNTDSLNENLGTVNNSLSNVNKHLEGVYDSIGALDWSMGEISYELESGFNAVSEAMSDINTNIGHGFNSVNRSISDLDTHLEYGFYAISSKLWEVNGSINSLNKNFTERLDVIQHAIQNQLQTAAREQFFLALESFTKGYYKDALDYCQEALKKIKTDCLTWYLLGHIYLYGAGKYDNVIDVKKAEEAFSKAAMYIDSDLNKGEESRKLGSKIYLHLGQARWNLSNDYLVEGNEKESLKYLELSKDDSSKAVGLDSKNLLAKYNETKALFYLNKKHDACNFLMELIEADKEYAIMAIEDKDLEPYLNDVKSCIEKLRKKLLEPIKAQYEEYIILFGEILAERQKKLKEIESFEYPREDISKLTQDIKRIPGDIINKLKSGLKVLENKEYFYLLKLKDYDVSSDKLVREFESWLNSFEFGYSSVFKKIEQKKIEEERRKKEELEKEERRKKEELEKEERRRREEEERRRKEQEQAEWERKRKAWEEQRRKDSEENEKRRIEENRRQEALWKQERKKQFIKSIFIIVFTSLVLFLFIRVLMFVVSTNRENKKLQTKMEVEGLLSMMKLPDSNLLVGKTEVTQELYEKVTENNPSYFVAHSEDEKLPVENVSWNEAVAFCNQLSEIQDLTPCYIIEYVDDDTKVTWNKEANGYRLPTLEEWQYAAKGGDDFEFSGGNILSGIGWYQDNSKKTNSVGQKKCNGYGFYDMSGNVSEWVWDADPDNGKSHYYCGGGWEESVALCKVSCKELCDANERRYSRGFRIVRKISSEEELTRFETERLNELTIIEKERLIEKEKERLIEKEKENKLANERKFMIKIPEKNLLIRATEVTVSFYTYIMDNSSIVNSELPITSVSFIDALSFCNELSRMEGLIPCYEEWHWDYYVYTNKVTRDEYKKAKEKNRKRLLVVTLNNAANGYRLPTLEEWQYAAQGGENYRFSGSMKLDEVGWYKENSNGKKQPVAQKKSNGYGLYDMSGNVWEWVFTSEEYYHACGGGFEDSVGRCETMSISSLDPTKKYHTMGFRIVRTAE
jgi:formylglycine-generating enzyme required for sulfatase activity